MRISILLPIYNEAQILPTLYQRLSATLTLLPHEVEMVFVNDGSQDDSLSLMKELRRKDPRVRIISLTRNFGQQMAFSAGLRHAQGDAVILMDADLQDPPDLIPRLLEKAEEGWDVVYAVRKRRKENLLKRTAYALFYRVLSRVSRPRIPVDSGDFSLVNRRVVDLINRMPERVRFLRGLRSWVGLKQTSLEYDRDPRFAGRPRYTLWKLILLALDEVVAFSYTPLRLASLLGFCSPGLAILGILVFACFRLFTHIFIPGYTSIVIAILFMGSVQLLTVGILGEYVARIYEEVKQRPPYIIDELVGFPPE